MEKIYIESIAKDRDGVRVVATDFTEDRDGERIDVEGLSIKNFLKNPVLMFGHSHGTPPIGKVTKVKKEDNRLTFEPVFSVATQFARDIKALWDEGVLNAVSIGFIPKMREDNIFTESELLEISIVNVPSNPQALAMAKSKGLNTSILDKETGSASLKTADVEWDAKGAVERMKELASGPDKETMEWTKYQRGFAWFDDSDSKNFSAYKLPFADVIDSELKAVWKGIVSAQAALLGARGGVQLTDDDRRKAHELLGAYYRKFDKEQPEFKGFESIAEVIKSNLLDKDKIEFISALHSSTKETKPVDEGVVETSEKQDNTHELLASAMHLALQQINKQTNHILKTAKYVRRQKS